MVDRDEWFAIHASGPAETALTRSLGRSVSSTGGAGFLVEPEAIPAVKAGFETAIQEMIQARRVAQEMGRMQGESVNPVMDRYVAAAVDRAVGPDGSFTVAAESAVAAYQDVIDQLDAALAGYRGSDDDSASTLRSES